MSTESDFDNHDPIYLPPGIEPEDMVYKWAFWMEGRDNMKRLDDSFYMIVPPERHPELYSDESVQGTISRKGSFLVERSKKIQAVIDERLNRVNKVLEYSEEHAGLSPMGLRLSRFMLNHREQYAKWILGVDIKDVDPLKELTSN